MRPALATAPVLGFGFDVLQKHQRLAAAINVTKVFDADVDGVAECFADLDVRDGGT